MLADQVKKLMNIFQKESKFKAVNAFEMMIQNRVHETDPRKFFEFFRNREIFMAVDHVGDEEFRFIQDGHFKTVSFVFLFTSLESLNFYLKVEGLPNQKVVQLSGDHIISILTKNNLGFILNSGVARPIIVSAENVNYAVKALASPSKGTANPRNIPAGSKVTLGIPAHIPEKKMRAISALIKNMPQVEYALFGLMVVQDGAQKPVVSYWMGLRPSSGVIDLEGLGVQIGGIWGDVSENTDGFVDAPLDVEILEEDKANQLREILIKISQDGWSSPQKN